MKKVNDMQWTDDPVADFEAYDAEQQEQLDKLPRCCECDKTIQNEYAYYINDEWICDSCMSTYRREVVADG